MSPIELRFTATARGGQVSAIVLRPAIAHCMFILGHGAGAGMRHVFMEWMARRLAEHGIATFRYQFPYMEQGSRRPDRAPVLVETVHAAITTAADSAVDLPIFVGGKSMGGRMTSLALAERDRPEVSGVVFLGFPLHPADRPGVSRATHLGDVTKPMLFIQGTRDKLADLELLTGVCSDLGPRATLHIVDGADHSFHVLKRSGRTDEDALEEVAHSAAEWMMSSLSAP